MIHILISNTRLSSCSNVFERELEPKPELNTWLDFREQSRTCPRRFHSSFVCRVSLAGRGASWQLLVIPRKRQPTPQSIGPTNGPGGKERSPLEVVNKSKMSPVKKFDTVTS